MDTLKTMTYEVDGRIARIALNRPARGNGLALAAAFAARGAAVVLADLDPAVHVIALSGNGKGFCGGYDLVAGAERLHEPSAATAASAPAGSGSTRAASPAATIRAGSGTRCSTTK